MAHVELDEHFLGFCEWAASVSMPIVVLSGGLIPLIEATLVKHGLCGIEVVANSVAVNEDGGAWTVQFRDNSIYGNDKVQAIKPYVEHRRTMGEAEPILLFAGDGISDLGVARLTDLLFAKQGEGTKLNRHYIDCYWCNKFSTNLADLVKYCKREQIPFTEFRDWGSILKTTQDL
jgi:2-hydroxy-3-keto-5-methylthiopentenyl-1-phosphate phosphatase